MERSVKQTEKEDGKKFTEYGNLKNHMEQTKREFKGKKIVIFHFSPGLMNYFIGKVGCSVSSELLTRI